MKDQNPVFAYPNSRREKIIYDTYCQRDPDLVNQLDYLIRIGHTPTDIENFMRSVTPTTSQVADHVYLIANYILRRKASQN